MFGLDDLLMFAALNDAEKEREREERSKWCRQEREQLEWEMRNADKYHLTRKIWNGERNIWRKKKRNLNKNCPPCYRVLVEMKGLVARICIMVTGAMMILCFLLNHFEGIMQSTGIIMIKCNTHLCKSRLQGGCYNI